MTEIKISQYFQTFKFLFVYLFLAVLDLRCLGLSLVVASRGASLVAAVLRLLIAVVSLVAEHRP